MPTDYTKDQHEKLIELVRQAIRQDEALRQLHSVGDKFRFVRDRLAGLLQNLEQHPVLSSQSETSSERQIMADEVLVYVYLFNANGTHLSSWQNMLTPKVFYEYSVNRPIYREKSQIEALLRAKSNKLQHAYLSIAVKKSSLLSQESNPDALGQPTIKVKEGALQFEKLIAFTHNHIDYVVNQEGEIVKKP